MFGQYVYKRASYVTWCIFLGYIIYLRNYATNARIRESLIVLYWDIFFLLILISLLKIHSTVWDHVSNIWRRMAQKLVVKNELDNMRRLLFKVCKSGNLLRGFFVIDESVLSQGYRPKPLVSGFIFNHLTAVNALVNTQHCCYWCPGAKAPGYQ